MVREMAAPLAGNGAAKKEICLPGPRRGMGVGAVVSATFLKKLSPTAQGRVMEVRVARSGARLKKLETGRRGALMRSSLTSLQSLPALRRPMLPWASQLATGASGVSIQLSRSFHGL